MRYRKHVACSFEAAAVKRVPTERATELTFGFPIFCSVVAVVVRGQVAVLIAVVFGYDTSGKVSSEEADMRLRVVKPVVVIA